MGVCHPSHKSFVDLEKGFDDVPCSVPLGDILLLSITWSQTSCLMTKVCFFSDKQIKFQVDNSLFHIIILALDCVEYKPLKK